jgi:hypothetical protein
MPQVCHAHNELCEISAVVGDKVAVCKPCADTAELPQEGTCELCQCHCKAPFGTVTKGSVCCIRCMEMAADVLQAYSARQVILADDPSWWELLEGDERRHDGDRGTEANKPNMPVDAEDFHSAIALHPSSRAIALER